MITGIIASGAGGRVPPFYVLLFKEHVTNIRNFTKKYFEKHGEACCADVYYALSEEIERLNVARAEIGEAPFRRPNYSSFSRYFWWFVLLGLIEPVDKYEAAIYPFLRQRHFYRLTGKGKAEEAAWQDPISVRHPELR